MPLYRNGAIPEIGHAAAAHKAVHIVSANVHTANSHYTKALSVIATQNPDIIALTETDTRWIENIAFLEKTYVHSLKHPRPDNFGMAVYSKMPFQAEIVDTGDYKLPMAVLDFADFRLIVAHPIHPVSPNNLHENKRYIEAIAQYATDSEKPVIVAGDLNSTLWGNAITPLFNADLISLNPSGIAYTWPSHLPFLAMQIDHFFVRGVKAADFKVLPNIGSDHYPIQATVAF
jgi:endonuclease/exonuclease/phosphatase (EEP) superfamily protein YafD